MKARRNYISTLRRRIDASGEAITLFDLLKAQRARSCCLDGTQQPSGCAQRAPKPTNKHRRATAPPAASYQLCDQGVFTLPDTALVARAQRLRLQNAQLEQQVAVLRDSLDSTSERENSAPQQPFETQIGAARVRLDELQAEIVRVRAQLSGAGRRVQNIAGGKTGEGSKGDKQSKDGWDLSLLEAHQQLQHVANAFARASRLQSPERAACALLEIRKRELSVQEEEAKHRVQELQSRVQEQQRRHALQMAALDNLRQQIALSEEITRRIRCFSAKALGGVAAFYDAQQLCAQLSEAVAGVALF